MNRKALQTHVALLVQDGIGATETQKTYPMSQQHENKTYTTSNCAT